MRIYKKLQKDIIKHVSLNTLLTVVSTINSNINSIKLNVHRSRNMHIKILNYLIILSSTEQVT